MNQSAVQGKACMK